MLNVLSAVNFESVILELNKTLPTSFKQLIMYNLVSVVNLERELETLNKVVK